VAAQYLRREQRRESNDGEEGREEGKEQIMNRAESIFVTSVVALIVGSFLLLCLSGLITPVIGLWVSR
jgi:hypothetical protein